MAKLQYFNITKVNVESQNYIKQQIKRSSKMQIFETPVLNLEF
jgi:hypothetical protein